MPTWGIFRLTLATGSQHGGTITMIVWGNSPATNHAVGLALGSVSGCGQPTGGNSLVVRSGQLVLANSSSGDHDREPLTFCTIKQSNLY